jgi:hypothetical protein
MTGKLTPEDAAPEAFEDEPTRREGADVPEPRAAEAASARKTGSYDGSPEFVAGRESGYESGFKAGVEKAIRALSVELTRAGATSDEIDRVVARIRAVANTGR